MHFFYHVSVLFALPLSNLEDGVENRALALQKRSPPTPEQLAKLKAAKLAKKAAKEAVKNDPQTIAAREAKKQADVEKERHAKETRAAEKAKKTLKAKAFVEGKVAEKLARKSPATIQPANLADKALVIGHPDPVKLQFTNGFLDKHTDNGVGSSIGKKQTVILSPISAFEPGTVAPNPKGPGERLTLTSQHSVDMRHFEKTSSGRLVKTGSGRGRVTVSGQQLGSIAIIDHFETHLPSRSSMKAPEVGKN